VSRLLSVLLVWAGAGGGLLLAAHDATGVSVSVTNVTAVQNKLGLLQVRCLLHECLPPSNPSVGAAL
jgi:hypothetical protein